MWWEPVEGESSYRGLKEQVERAEGSNPFIFLQCQLVEYTSIETFGSSAASSQLDLNGMTPCKSLC